MRKTLIAMLAAAMILTFAGLGLAGHADDQDGFKGPSGLTNGANMWKYISKDEPYTKWDLWPGKGKMFEGTEPHGALLTVYVTKGAHKAISKNKGKFTQGNIIVKENYKPDKTLAAITIMYKAKGYNPEAGDWFWAKYNPDGTVDKEGKVGGCIKCHSAKADNDWVFTGDIK